jgi:predicted nuclease with TOPRIM domain
MAEAEADELMKRLAKCKIDHERIEALFNSVKDTISTIRQRFEEFKEP